MPSPLISDSPISSVFPPAESMIVGSLPCVLFNSLPLFVSFDSMFVGINLFIWLCPSSLMSPFRSVQARLRILSTPESSLTGIQTAEGVGILGGGGTWRRDEIESDRADEVEEGGAEIKLNTK